MTEVLLVHGLWFRAYCMRAMAIRLKRLGYRVRWFNYPTTSVQLATSAERLYRHCQRSEAETTHLVGHSLGGLLILEMLQQCQWARKGRVLCMGTPLNGSAVARRAAAWPGGDFLFGQARLLLSSGELGWPENREIGMIAGTRALGLGRVTGGLEIPNDGTVSVAETMHSGLSARIELPVTHTSMLYRKMVALQAGVFLHTGQFETGET